MYLFSRTANMPAWDNRGKNEQNQEIKQQITIYCI